MVDLLDSSPLRGLSRCLPWIFQNPTDLSPLPSFKHRGAAYVFRRYGRGGAIEGRLFGFFFSAGSIVALFAFGWSIARPRVSSTPPAKSTLGARNGAGLFSVLHHAQLAASYLTLRQLSNHPKRISGTGRCLETAWWLALGFFYFALEQGKPDYSLDL